ncbi:MAG: hypothetical protein AAF371_15305, partial [Pseudomonadota bacterium]
MPRRSLRRRLTPDRQARVTEPREEVGDAQIDVTVHLGRYPVEPRRPPLHKRQRRDAVGGGDCK